MAKRSSLRASDGDREKVAERLGHAATEGRILAHELEERLAATLRARTYGELDAVVEDLPGAGVPRRSRAKRARQLIAVQPVLALAMAAAAILILLLVAMVVFVGLIAFVGLWFLLGMVTLVHRGGRGGSGRYVRGRYVGGRYRGLPPHRRITSRDARGAWPYW